MYYVLWYFLVCFLFHIKNLTHILNRKKYHLHFFFASSIKANLILFAKGDAYPETPCGFLGYESQAS